MPEKKIKVVFDWGDKVYLITDPYQLLYMVVGHKISPNGILYEIQHNLEDPALVYVMELSPDRDMAPAGVRPEPDVDE